MGGGGLRQVQNDHTDTRRAVEQLIAVHNNFVHMTFWKRIKWVVFGLKKGAIK